MNATPDQNVQSLELSEKKVPMVGTYPGKSSNDWNFILGAL